MNKKYTPLILMLTRSQAMQTTLEAFFNQYNTSLRVREAAPLIPQKSMNHENTSSQNLLEAEIETLLNLTNLTEITLNVACSQMLVAEEYKILESTEVALLGSYVKTANIPSEQFGMEFVAVQFAYLMYESRQKQKTISIENIIDFYKLIGFIAEPFQLLELTFNNAIIEIQDKSPETWLLQIIINPSESYHYEIKKETANKLQGNINQSQAALHLFLIAVYEKYFTPQYIGQFNRIKQTVKKNNYRYKKDANVKLIINSTENKHIPRISPSTILGHDKKIVEQNMKFLFRPEYQNKPIKSWTNAMQSRLNMAHILKYPSVYFVDPSFHLQK